jgi:hypothetical protein
MQVVSKATAIDELEQISSDVDDVKDDVSKGNLESVAEDLEALADRLLAVKGWIETGGE